MGKSYMVPGTDGFQCPCGATFTTSKDAMGHLLIHALIGDVMDYDKSVDMLYHTHCCVVNDEVCYTVTRKKTINCDLAQCEADVLFEGLAAVYR